MTLLAASLLVAAAFATPSKDAPPFVLVEGLLPHRDHSNAGSERAITHMVGAGVCVLDFDADGDWDLFLPDRRLADGSGGSRLFRGNGALGFEDVTPEVGIDDRGWSVGCAIGDVDNDGDSDLYVTRVGRNSLYRNHGDGTFGEVEAGAEHDSWSTGAAFGDLDLDGSLDLYVCSYIDLRSVHPAERCLYFGVEVFCGPNGLPGALDALYRNERTGFRFRDMSSSLPETPAARGFSVLLVDLDSDRLPEIRVSNDASMQFLFRNLGGFQFEDASLVSGAGFSALGMEQSGMGLAAGDLDRDGDEDLYVTNFQRDYNTLFRNDGGLSFEDVTAASGLALPTLPHLGWGTAFLDVGNDGVLDLFVANGHIYPELAEHREVGEPYQQPVQLFLGNGAGRFHEIAPSADPVEKLGRGTAVADLDGNGSLDVIVTHLGGAPDLYRGASRAGNWIGVRLVGSSSNRDGLGAVVRIGDQRRELRLSDGFLGSNEPIAHFGIGDAAGIARIDVDWPSGQSDSCTELAVNRIHLVKEGLGCLQ
jgi:hypothetical protein